jgi:hypothetical protein
VVVNEAAKMKTAKRRRRRKWQRNGGRKSGASLSRWRNLISNMACGSENGGGAPALRWRRGAPAARRRRAWSAPWRTWGIVAGGYARHVASSKEAAV